MIDIPLSLYIHFPWCVKKCPYCDFNSHELRGELYEQEYITQLIKDLDANLKDETRSSLVSIFMGGGTPSLFSPDSIATLMQAIGSRLDINSCEVTLEANPGAVDQSHFDGYLEAGINRLSIGAQSFNNDSLAALGRIHQAGEIVSAFRGARNAGFERINLDVMYGLPKQNKESAIDDLQTAIALEPEHLSWYQLTIEPNTYFYSHEPELPDEDTIYEAYLDGTDILLKNEFFQYEVSAYSKPHEQARHNINYWQFGDYLGIGAGAHGKLTRANGIVRTTTTRVPRDYLISPNTSVQRIADDEITVEFLLNALRLAEGFTKELFEERTGRPFSDLKNFIERGQDKELIEVINDNVVRPTTMGLRYLNDLLLLV